jgi:expansin (peptidoglycan-binding protein)
MRPTLGLLSMLLVSCARNAPGCAGNSPAMAGDEGGSTATIEAGVTTTSEAGFGAAADQTPFGALENGIATSYDATAVGYCSFDAAPVDDVVALDTRQYQHAAWCGACVRVDGPKGSIKARVVDRCPTCESRTHLDLSKSAFTKIGDLSEGRINVKWQFIPCAVTGNIAYHFKDGSNEDWTAVQIRNHRMPIKSVEAKVNGAWIPLARTDYNFFVYDPGLGQGPYELRVTSSEGKTVEDMGIPFAPGTTVSGTGQL